MLLLGTKYMSKPGLDELLREALSVKPAQLSFEMALGDLLGELEEAPPHLQSTLVASAVAFASLCVARMAMYHVEDHDGIGCAQSMTQGIPVYMAQMIVERCKEIAEEKGLENPFPESSVNASLLKELLDEVGSW